MVDVAKETYEKRAKKAIEFARKKAKECKTWIEFSNALFGIGGKLGELFTDEKERTRFSKSPECDEIMEIMEQMQGPDLTSTVSGNFMIRGPRSLHAVLQAEADAEGVSLNQLCIAKLSRQFRAMAVEK